MTLFGDGSAAIILEKGIGKSGVIQFKHETYTEGIHAAEIPGGHVKKWIKDYPYDPKIHHFQMDSRKLLRFTYSIYLILLLIFLNLQGHLGQK